VSKLLKALACGLVLVIAGCDRFLAREPDFSRGGTYLLLRLDADVLRAERLDQTAEQMADALRARSIRFSGRGVLGDAARIQLADRGDLERALLAMAAMPEGESYVFSESEGFIEARFTESAMANLVQTAIEETIAVLSRRMDPEQPVEITNAGGDLLRIRMPAGTNVDVVRARATPTAKLTFHLVREVPPGDAAAGFLPPGMMLAEALAGVGHNAEVVEARPRLSGDMIERASPYNDEYSGAIGLSFQLNAEGARRFCRVTTEHTNERFAILLDSRVITAPMINEPICGGSGQISGNFSAAEASDLAAMLNAGALPAPLIVVEGGVIAPP
jgi:preprotein translocase subunit SecD